VDRNGDGVISFAEADVNGTPDGLPNPWLYLPPTASNRFAITREIKDGLLARRRQPSHSRGSRVRLSPRVPRFLGWELFRLRRCWRYLCPPIHCG